MRNILILTVYSLFGLFGCSAPGSAFENSTTNQNALTAPATNARELNVTTDLMDKEDIERIVRERLMRQIVNINSTVLLSDKTAILPISSWPEEIIPSLSDAYDQANRNDNDHPLRGGD